MIKQTEIMTAIEMLIAKEFKQTVIYEELMPIDFVRPSFLIACGKRTQTDMNKTTINVKSNFTLACYALTDEYSHTHARDLMDTAHRVLLLFEPFSIKVADRWISVKASITDRTVDECFLSLDFEYCDERILNATDTPSTLMGELELNLKKENNNNGNTKH